MESHPKFLVIFISANDGPGGAGAAALRLAEALSAVDQDFKVILRTSTSVSQSPLVVSGMPDLPSVRASARRYLQVFFRRFGKVLFRLFGGTGVYSVAKTNTGIGEDIRRRRPDLVVINWLGDSVGSLEELRDLGVPVVVRLSDHWFVTAPLHFEHLVSGVRQAWNRVLSRILVTWNPGEAKKRAYSFLKSECVGLIYPSSAVPEPISDLARNLGIELAALPNPVPSFSFNARARTDLEIRKDVIAIGFAGDKAVRDPRKGFQLLTEALQRLSRENYRLLEHCELHVVGGLEVSSHRLNGLRVVNHGRKNPKQMADFYSALDLLAFPSIAETFGNVSLEAQSVGTPVVGFRVGALQDQIEDNVTGFLASEVSLEGLIEALRRALSDPTALPKMGTLAQKRVQQKFSEARVAQEYAEFFRRHIRETTMGRREV